jgi:hypothetical protein
MVIGFWLMVLDLFCGSAYDPVNYEISRCADQIQYQNPFFTLLSPAIPDKLAVHPWMKAAYDDGMTGTNCLQILLGVFENIK